MEGVLIYRPGYGSYVHDVKEDNLLNPHHVFNPPGVYRRVHESCLGEEFILPAYAMGINNGRGGWIDVGLKFAFSIGLSPNHLCNARPNDRTVASIYVKRSYIKNAKKNS